MPSAVAQFARHADGSFVRPIPVDNMYGQAKPAKKQPSVDETLNMHYDRLAMWHKEKLDTDVQWLKGEAPDPTTSPIVVDDELPRDKRVKARKQPETKMSLEDMQKQLPAHKAGEAHLRNRPQSSRSGYGVLSALRHGWRLQPTGR